MKLTQLALLTGFAISFSAGAETSLSDIEARLNSLEKRASEAEARAVAAEKKSRTSGKFNGPEYGAGRKYRPGEYIRFQ
ncbi:carbohydrate porin [Morganella morganii]|nr:carbohydrate porin [Morganella morganii]QXO66234.1 carbohydrate porin [Morganella morganii]